MTDEPTTAVTATTVISVSNLGVLIDGQLSMALPVLLFQLRRLRLVRSSFTLEAAKTLVHEFVSSRNNTLLYIIGDGLMKKLQTVQNLAARVVTDTSKFDYITMVLCNLHWLPIWQRILFKLAMIVFKCLHGLTPSYLADDCIFLSICGSRSTSSALRRHHETVGRANKNSRRHKRVCSICCCHLEQSTNRAQTDVVHPDILAEVENFLHQLDNVTAAHLRTV